MNSPARVYPELSRRGFTLIELLVVISIISILAAIGILNFRNYASGQDPVKAAGEIQSILRLAQNNATSSTFCGARSGVDWMVIFRVDKRNIDLACGPNSEIQKTYTLQGAEINTIQGSSCTGPVNPLTLTYSAGSGALNFSSQTALSPCLSSADWTFTIRNTVDTGKSKSFKLSKGGAIDVE